MDDLEFRRRMMQMNKRGGGGGELSDYVQDGLVWHLDGIERGSNTNKWRELINGVDMNLDDPSLMESNCINCTRDRGYGAYLVDNTISVDGVNGTVEVVIHPANDLSGRTAFVFAGNISYSSQNAILALYGGTTVYHTINNAPVHRLNTTSGAMIISANNTLAIQNGVELSKSGSDNYNTSTIRLQVGYKGSTDAQFLGRIYAIRVYNRRLTQEEILQNQRNDNIRFNLGLSI